MHPMNKKVATSSYSPQMVAELLIKGKVDKSFAELIARYIQE